MDGQGAIEKELWSRCASGDSDARDQLFLRHAPWAASIAGHVHARVRAYRVDREDFVQNATVGLLEAISRYDPDRGIAFRSYAHPRVRGAVFNGLRAILGDRTPPSYETRLAERLQYMHEAQKDDAFDTVVTSIINLGLGLLIDEAAVATEEDGFSYAHQSRIEARLFAAVRNLPERMQLIIRAHYFQHVPFLEIATQLSLTKGRVSQLHKEALSKLRTMCSDLGTPP